MEPGIYSYVFLELVKDKAMARFGHRRQAYPLTRFDLAHRIAPIEPERPSRCDCCGSREFRQHHGRHVCAYCRTEG